MDSYSSSYSQTDTFQTTDFQPDSYSNAQPDIYSNSQPDIYSNSQPSGYSNVQPIGYSNSQPNYYLSPLPDNYTYVQDTTYTELQYNAQQVQSNSIGINIDVQPNDARPGDVPQPEIQRYYSQQPQQNQVNNPVQEGVYGNSWQQGPVGTPPPQWNVPQNGYAQQPAGYVNGYPAPQQLPVPQHMPIPSPFHGAAFSTDPPPNSDEWRSSILDGGKDITTCCIGAWCPCVLIGQIIEVVDRGNTSCFSAGAIWYLIQVHTLCGAFYTAPYRRRLRARFGLPESPMPDILTEFVCQPCSACQMHYELKSRGCDPALGYDAVKHTYNAPRQPPPRQQMMR